MKYHKTRVIIASTVCFSQSPYALEELTKESSPLKVSQPFKLPTGKDYIDLENDVLSCHLPPDISPDSYRSGFMDDSKLDVLLERDDFREWMGKPPSPLNWQGVPCAIGMNMSFSGIGQLGSAYAKDLVRVIFKKRFFSPEENKIIPSVDLRSWVSHKLVSLENYPEKFVLSLEFNTQGNFNKRYMKSDGDFFVLHLIYPIGTRLFIQREESLMEEIHLGDLFYSVFLSNDYFRTFVGHQLKEVNLEKIRKLNFLTTQFSYQMP